MEQSPSWEVDQFSQLTKKLPEFYGTRRFFTVLTSARHLNLFWAKCLPTSCCKYQTSVKLNVWPYYSFTDLEFILLVLYAVAAVLLTHKDSNMSFIKRDVSLIWLVARFCNVRLCWLCHLHNKIKHRFPCLLKIVSLSVRFYHAFKETVSNYTHLSRLIIIPISMAAITYTAGEFNLRLGSIGQNSKIILRWGILAIIVHLTPDTYVF
jgi:hypothetical protein